MAKDRLQGAVDLVCTKSPPYCNDCGRLMKWYEPTGKTECYCPKCDVEDGDVVSVLML